MSKWTLTVRIEGDSLESIKRTFDHAAGRIAKAKVPADLSMYWAGGSGCGTDASVTSCSSDYTCPLEDQIKEMRRQADRLEETLRAGGSH